MILRADSWIWHFCGLILNPNSFFTVPFVLTKFVPAIMNSFSATIILLFSLLLSLVHSQDMNRGFIRRLHYDHQHSGQQSSERRSKRHHWMAFPHHRDQHHGKPGKHYNEVDMELYLRSSKKHNTHHEGHPDALEYLKKADKSGSKQIEEALHGTDSDSESSSRSSSISSSSSSSTKSSTSSSDDESSREPKIEVGVLEVEEVARVEQEENAGDGSN
jgi:hypothetical protein